MLILLEKNVIFPKFAHLLTMLGVGFGLIKSNSFSFLAFASL